MKFIFKLIILAVSLNQMAMKYESKVQNQSPEMSAAHHASLQIKSDAEHYRSMRDNSSDKEVQWVYNTLASVKESNSCSVELVQCTSSAGGNGRGNGNCISNFNSCVDQQGV